MTLREGRKAAPARARRELAAESERADQLWEILSDLKHVVIPRLENTVETLTKQLETLRTKGQSSA
jgi:hypothetical protein